MKITLKLFTVLFVSLLLSCGGKEEKKKEKVQLKKQTTEKKAETKSTVPPSKTIDLANKGVGPITSLTLPDTIDQNMVIKGKEVFDKMCTACHRTDKKFIGPAPTKLLERRTPEWVMNMMLNPDEMVQKDPLAKALLMEFNGSPMANQNLTEEEARSVLEYFRTLK